jgi:hypothetical protein
MPAIHRNSPHLVLLLTLGGFLCTLFGFFAFGQRYALASVFLGADFLFGLPLTKSDSYKVLFVGIQSLGAVGLGLTMLISGVVVAVVNASRARSATESTRDVAPVTTGR